MDGHWRQGLYRRQRERLLWDHCFIGIRQYAACKWKRHNCWQRQPVAWHLVQPELSPRTLPTASEHHQNKNKQPASMSQRVCQDAAHATATMTSMLRSTRKENSPGKCPEFKLRLPCERAARCASLLVPNCHLYCFEAQAGCNPRATAPRGAGKQR